LEAQYGIVIPEDPAYATVGGFVLDQLGFIPSGGESFVHGDLRFTIAEMDGKRVARVKMERITPADGKRNNVSETSPGKAAKSTVSRS
jgi:putative hemolysin